MSDLQKMSRNTTKGVSYGLIAHFIWGFSVVYWYILSSLNPISILSHRMVWSWVFLLLVLLITRKFHEVKEGFRNKQVVKILTIGVVLLCTNWGIFLWAISTGHAIEGSLGYFITPLINILMGRIFFKDTLSRIQLISIYMTALVLIISVVMYGSIPWISLFVGGSFALYGFVQKKVEIDSVPGLFIEITIMLPFALAWLFFMDGPDLGLSGQGIGWVLLLFSTSLFTALPLCLFAYAVKSLSLTTIGFLQYVSPSIQFLLAIFVLKEQLKPSDMFVFPVIWLALAIYAWETLYHLKRLPKAPS